MSAHTCQETGRGARGFRRWPAAGRVLAGAVALAAALAAPATAQEPAGVREFGGAEGRAVGSAQAAAAATAAGGVAPGIEGMARAEAARNFRLADFVVAPGDDEGRLLVRLRPSITVAPSERLWARVEGQWYAFADERDTSEIGLYQAFVKASAPGRAEAALKAGRQEFVYGSAFILGADAFYDGLSFDAVKVSLGRTGRVSIDLLGGRYVARNSGGMEGTLYGIYGVVPVRGALSVDLYGFRDTGGAGATHVGGAHEVTYSVGTRLVGRVAGAVAFEVEPVYQFGRKDRDGAGHDAIAAYGGHADVTVELASGRYPGKVFFSCAYGSGDGNPGEGRFTEFHNPGNDTPLVGDTSVVGELGGLTAGTATASGLLVVTAAGAIDLTKTFNLSASVHHFRANEVPAGFSRDIGVEANLVLTHRIRDNVSVLLSENRFFTGGFFRDATGSGRDLNYVYLQLQATY